MVVDIQERGLAQKWVNYQVNTRQELKGMLQITHKWDNLYK